jgi:hypothetical protein
MGRQRGHTYYRERQHLAAGWHISAFVVLIVKEIDIRLIVKPHEKSQEEAFKN